MKFWLVVFSMALSACSLLGHHVQPEVALAGLRMGPGDGLHQTLLVDLVITNPDSSPLKLNALSYRVRVDGRELASGSSREPLDVAAGASARYTVPASINLMSSFGFIKDVLMKPKNKINYEVNATLEPAGLFSVPISVRKADSIELPQ
jgi:LEA14-like dessication related protein